MHILTLAIAMLYIHIRTCNIFMQMKLLYICMYTHVLCRGIEAVMFVIDSSDKLRMPVAQEELKTLLSHSS